MENKKAVGSHSLDFFRRSVVEVDPHVEVVMLTGVNQRLPHMIVLTEGVNDRRGFHKVRPLPNYVDNVHIRASPLRPELFTHYLSTRRSIAD